MTEAEWLACDDPEKMLDFLNGKVTERKLRLLACACCRRIWDLLTDDRTRRAVEAGELYADGLISREALRQSEEAGRRAYIELLGGGDSQAATQARWAASVGIGPPRGQEYSPGDLPAICWLAARAIDHEKGRLWVEERKWQFQRFCDLFGNVFHPPSFDPGWLAWNGSVTLSLAQTIYEGRAFDRLPILADALEDAGCTDAAILAHCRGPGPHVRGCWVVDLILGKS
jgi:hypothetical protein